MNQSTPANLLGISEARSGPKFLGGANDLTPGFLKFARPMLQRKWLILVSSLVTAGLGFFAASQMTPIFRSTVTLLVETSRANIVSVQEVYTGSVANREHFQTQAEFLRSRDVTLRTIRSLKLTDHPLFDLRQHKTGMPGVLERYLASPITPVGQEQIEAHAVTRLSESLNVEPLRLSQMIRVSFDSPDRQLAADIANRIAHSYIQADMDAKDQMTQAATQWLGTRLTELKKRLESSEALLQESREKRGLVLSPTTAQGGNALQLEEFSRKLVDARVRLTAAQDAYNQVSVGGIKARSASIVLTNPMVARAVQFEGDAEKKVAEMSDRFGPAHPLYLAAANEVKIAREQTQQMVATVIDSVAKEFAAAKSALRSIEEAIEQSRGSLQEFNRKEVGVSPLEREVSANRELYERFLARVKETDITGDIRSAPARIIDPAVPSLVPVKPDRVRLTILFGLIGLFVMAAIVLLIDRMRSTLRTTADVENELGQSLLAAVPTMSRKQSRHSSVIMLEDPTSAVAESIRTVATSVMLSMAGIPRKVFAITSAIASEGKSTVACNLALFHGRTKRVLLVDADLRRPSLAAKLRVDSGLKGLGEFLSETATFDKCVHKLADFDISLMPSGNYKVNPLEMLSGVALQRLLSVAENHFDVVIIDCAPVGLVSDALIVAAEVPGTIVVARSDMTAIQVVRSALTRLEGAGANVLGVVLNGHDFSRAERFYGDYTAQTGYGYSRAYGVEKAV